jgi:hypothetical protein
VTPPNTLSPHLDPVIIVRPRESGPGRWIYETGVRIGGCAGAKLLVGPAASIDLLGSMEKWSCNIQQQTVSVAKPRMVGPHTNSGARYLSIPNRCQVSVYSKLK